MCKLGLHSMNVQNMTDICCADRDLDGVDDCRDGCPTDPAKTSPGVCGCNNPETRPCSRAPAPSPFSFSRFSFNSASSPASSPFR